MFAGTILILDPDVDAAEAIASRLAEDDEYRVFVCSVPRDAEKRLADVDVDLVIAAEGGERYSSLDFLKQLRISKPTVLRVLVGERPEGSSVRRAVREAAIFQYLIKPLEAEQVALMVRRALETRELARRHRILSRELKFSDDSPIFSRDPVDDELGDGAYRFEKMVYASPAMAELCGLARQAARTELPILIQGETGTGKELLARGIHYHSERGNSPLMVQNCGGLSDELLHSELFGHVRGAFTGAVSDRLGLFRAADGGTVFLDEISEVSPAFQVSLLRLLQEGEVKPLGSDRTLHCDVRVIAASNRPLAELVRQKAFRQDLYFRLKGFELQVPGLRERPEDVSVLAAYFVKKHGEAMGRRVLGVTRDLLARLEAYDFPGNVRELENEIRRMVALAQNGDYLSLRHISPTLADVKAKPLPEADANGFRLEGGTLKEEVERLETRIVADALRQYRWNQSKVASELGLSRVGLANKIKRYGLDRGQEGAAPG
ncbi:MAG: sigma-54 dependent transcriptional regulator [Alphaproteobacteria bacterium]